MYYTSREEKMGAEKIAGEVAIGGNLIYMLYKPHGFYYESVICAKVVKRARKGFRGIFKAYIVSLLIAYIKPCNGIFAFQNWVYTFIYHWPMKDSLFLVPCALNFFLDFCSYLKVMRRIIQYIVSLHVV